MNVIKYNNLEDFVLGGHSFAGKVAAAVADRVHEKVVYVDAFRPERVRTPQGGFNPSSEFGPPSQGGYTIPLTEGIIDRIGKDVVGSNRKWMMNMATPWPIELATDPITLSENYDDLKEAYVFCSLRGIQSTKSSPGSGGSYKVPTR